MGKKKIIDINYSKERVVLSDVLPFETPLIFSNRHFYNFLKQHSFMLDNPQEISNKIHQIEASLKFAKSYKDQLVKELQILKIVSDLMFSKSYDKGLISKPFTFKIRHKESDFRELSVIHPKNQLEVVKFYDRYKDLILYYTSLSPFSLRKPHKLAKYTFFNDLLHKKRNDLDEPQGGVEQYDIEYENLKSFFAVKKYNSIHKFYESYQFHRAEKKYNHLYKFDISKCFDSIYSHTIAWALFNKEILKNNINDLSSTFGGEFDFLMQKMNYNETNGIIIGSEFSRIFAEIILQQVDVNVYDCLKNKKNELDCLVYKVDYEIFRYVDDYFVFYNQEQTINEILKEFKIQLKEYKLAFNDAKSIQYHKPIITEISIAKQKISDLFRDYLKLKEKDGKLLIDGEEENDAEGDFDENTREKSIFFNANHIITRFKIIISQTGVEYKDIMNFSLAILDKKTSSLIKKHKSIGQVKNKEKVFLKAFLQILDIAFFLYSVSPRVNSTIKVCMIVEKLSKFLIRGASNKSDEPFNDSNKHLLLKKCNDDIILVLQKNKSSQFVQIETLYLLICLSQLGREYRLSLRSLREYFGIFENNNGEIKFKHELNYFSIMVLLFYIKNISIYQELKQPIKDHICERFKNVNREDRRSNTELTLLLFDVLTCPYLDDEYRKTDAYGKFKAATKLEDKRKYKKEFSKTRYKYKRKLLTLNDVAANHIELIESRKYWFIKWTDFNFGMELEAKKSQEVYG
ncbi:antiviral reverse transcriptase Drt3b [Mucilaginibacter ginsenosidivorax]|uniref:RNA-directed DNA polymerase n=1 Tax=Mucilaginibacter ginsenosidivorax TaxID=862126 RepID=A0A5B8W0D3_9SPHI|nr:antiviral reverse transcriptase Drt3b [Mucilaginibacter ginsenosidivorax]QEC77101.1 RNA-directed DNA polymerase [Mucilaginibacter ginsenosidivorax]